MTKQSVYIETRILHQNQIYFILISNINCYLAQICSVFGNKLIHHHFIISSFKNDISNWVHTIYLATRCNLIHLFKC